MIDHMALSAKNAWLYEYRRVYIIFTVAEIIEKLCRADQKANKLLKEHNFLQILGTFAYQRQAEQAACEAEAVGSAWPCWCGVSHASYKSPRTSNRGVQINWKY